MTSRYRAFARRFATRFRRSAGRVLRRVGITSADHKSQATPAPATSPPPPLSAPFGRVTPSRAARPDVTFVIPVFNSEEWILACVSSVLAQGGVDLEVVCVNDGSTDGTRAILRELSESDPRVTVLDQENSGQSVARNRGLDATTGRYLIYLDSDDYWPEDALLDLVQRADADGLDLLLFDSVAFRDGDVDERTWRWYSTYYQRSRAYDEPIEGVELMAKMRRNKDYRPHVGLYMARTSFVKSIGVRFIPGIVHQDNPYTFRLILNCPRAAHTAVNAYARRIRPGSTITTLSAERSARGYFLSYLEMTRELRGRALPASAVADVHNIVDYVYDGARKQFGLISDEAAVALGAIDVSEDAQALFSSLRRGEKITLS